MQRKNKSLLASILLSCIPYTEENILFTTNPRKFFWRLERDHQVNKNSVNQAISRAKRTGYLREVEQKHSQNNLEVTNSGKLKILKHLSADKNWDSKWRIVLFDIPEEERKKRNIFRKYLKELGFKQHQLSAWICPFDQTAAIDLIISDLEIEPYVKYLIGDSIIGEKELLKEFNVR